MAQMTVGIRELKVRLSSYVKQVKGGATLIITDRGKPVGQIMPIQPSLAARIHELSQTGLVSWSGRKLEPKSPVAQLEGRKTVAEVLLENRE